jgi:DNA-binding NtrC family response regulator
MRTVLVVEDDAQVLVLSEAILHEAGYQTLSAATAEEARALLDSEQPIELLFTDINLPGELDGVHLAAHAHQRRAGLPVIYTSGRGMTDGMRAMLVEPYAFLQKPYTPQQVTDAAGELLQQQGKHRS